MATSLGSVNWGSGPTLPCAWSYDRQRSGANMQYRIYGTVNVGGSSRYFGYYIDASVYLDGAYAYSVRLKENSPSQWSGELTFDTGWKTVSGKVSGSTALTITLSTNAPRGAASWNYTLAVDPAGSDISASNGTLGVAQTITLTRRNSAFTDTVTWACGSQSGTIATKSSATSFQFTPPLSLASQNTSGTTVPITFTVQTFNGNTAVQSKSVTVTETIPASVKPSVALAISDPTGYLTKYGAYVQSKSTLRAVITATTSYGSAINTYKLVADGNTYTSQNTTTPVLQATGAQTVTATVTDKRGRTSDPATASYTVLAYAQPTLSSCVIQRCDSGGTADPEGHYMSVSFTGAITALNNRNSATWSISYRVTGAGTWTDVPLSSLTGNYTPTHQEIIAASDANTFEVEVRATDDFGTITVGTGSIPVAFTIMNWRTEGDGVAIGGINTKAGLQIYMDTDLDGELNVSGNIYTQGANATDVVLECKNLLPITATSLTTNGVTYTVNDDGTIKASGTASSLAQITAGYVPVTAGESYVLSGCGGTGSATTYFLRFVFRASSGTGIIADGSLYQDDYGNGLTRTAPSGAVAVYCYPTVLSGATVNNLVFKPMVRDASITDDNYVPHAMTNLDLTNRFIVVTGRYPASGNFNFNYSGPFYPTVTIPDGYMALLCGPARTNGFVGSASVVDSIFGATGTLNNQISIWVYAGGTGYINFKVLCTKI